MYSDIPVQGQDRRISIAFNIDASKVREIDVGACFELGTKDFILDPHVRVVCVWSSCGATLACTVYT